MSVGIRLAMVFIIFLMISCSASKQNGFSYRPAFQGPDVSATITESPVEQRSREELPTPLEKTYPSVPNQLILSNNALNENSAVADLAKIVDQQLTVNAQQERVDARKAVSGIAEAYAAEHKITLTPKQLRKLDRFAGKLEKKQQKQADVEWGPKNNLEIFLLAAAGVGFVVGFFSSFGWVIFLIAALIYLYLKLLKN